MKALDLVHLLVICEPEAAELECPHTFGYVVYFCSRCTEVFDSGENENNQTESTEEQKTVYSKDC